MGVEQWWRSNGGGDRERNVGLECRERERLIERQTERKRNVERENHTSDFVGFKDRFRRK